MSNLVVKFYSRYELTEKDLEEMHLVFRKYYLNAEMNTFKNDLDKKNGVFLLRDKSTDNIVGFSTILEMRMRINGKKVLGFFSGDTIVEEQYWGNNPLTGEIVKYFVKKLFLHPFTPIYWFLISKGYKTYLLLANNFLQYYPCHNRENKHLEDIAVGYSTYLFNDYFDKKKKIIDFGANYQALKGGVAEITAEMCSKYPKIAFFNEKNPTWDRGTELPCVGVLNWPVILNKIFVKPLKKPLKVFFSSFSHGKTPRRLASQRKAM
ncbi:MAG: hypothetical protein KKD44_00125 [Proteobacteria bacterium]|nr:hypothetical protein [Pseudomonadota bacterium]